MSKIKKVFWLIGSNGNKVDEGACSLPTQLDILKHFLVLHLNEKKTINDSARELAEKVIVISEKINSECIEIHNIMKKIKILYTNYSLLKKAKSSTSKCQLEKRDNFLNSLSSYFFINYSLPKKIVCEKTKSNDRITNDSLNLEMPRLRNKIEGKVKYTLPDFEKGDASGNTSDPSYEPPIKLRKKIIRKSVLTTDLCLALDRTKDRRHHILELLPGAVFDLLFEVSSGPNIKLFNRFSLSWNTIDTNIRQDATQDSAISALILPSRERLIQFIRQQLDEFHSRCDYKELLLLMLIFLGEENANKITVYAPGAYHRARWMAKIIYCLKIYIFRSQFKITAKELNGLRQFNVFIARIHIQNWYTCQSPTMAPFNSLKILKELLEYHNVNNKISEVALKKFSGHLWYLSEWLSGLALFDARVSLDEKRKMIIALGREGTNDPPNRIQITKSDIPEKCVSDFISKNSTMLFTSNNISLEFMKKDTSMWKEDPLYLKAQEIVQQWPVVNDLAERGVALAQDFNPILAKYEEQKQ